MKIENYLKLDIVSPKLILEWTERSLPNGEIIGKIKKSL